MASDLVEWYAGDIRIPVSDTSGVRSNSPTKQVKKRGLVNLLIRVGDLAVKITPSPADNAVWSKIRSYIKKQEK